MIEVAMVVIVNTRSSSGVGSRGSRVNTTQTSIIVAVAVAEEATKTNP